MTQDQRKRLLYAVAGATFGLLLADRLAFTPLYNHWRQTEDRLAGLRSELEKDRGLVEAAAAWKERMTRVEASMYQGGDAEVERQVMGQISAQASRYGVAIGTLRPQWQEADAAGPRRLQLRMTASGGTAAVVPFLVALETSPKPVRLGTLVLRSKNETGIELEAESQIEVAVLPPATPAVKEEKP